MKEEIENILKLEYTTREMVDRLHELFLDQYQIYRETVIPMPNTNRVEVVDNNGRSYVNWKSGNQVELQIQDSGKTLKVFIKEGGGR